MGEERQGWVMPVLLRFIVAGMVVISSGWAWAQQSKATRELLLLLPEPISLRTSISQPIEGAARTVLTPARQTDFPGGAETYSSDEFSKLGFSAATFVERARAAADKRLARLQPEYIRADDGAIQYAVYRDDSGLMATLLSAPSLGRIFQKIFGDKIWVAIPDRYALYVFPAKEEALKEFVPDLVDRYNNNPYAASPELFELSKDESVPRVIAAFGS